jgi:hypothetical protein
MATMPIVGYAHESCPSRPLAETVATGSWDAVDNAVTRGATILLTISPC